MFDRLWRGGNRSSKEWYKVAAFFVIITIFLIWPLLLRPDRVYLTAPPEYYVFQDQEEWGLQWFVGHERLGKEYLDHEGHMARVDLAADQLQRGKWPLKMASTYTVPPTYVLPGAILTLLFSLPIVLYHNAFFVLSMTLAGLFTYLFVKEVLENRQVALLAGALYMSSFYIFNVYTFGHTNQWQIQWIPLILYSVEKIRAESNARTIVLLGVALSLQAVSSEQYTIYLSFVLPIYILVRLFCGSSGYRDLSFWKGSLVASLLASLLSSPYLYAKLSMAETGVTEIRSIGDNMYHWNVIEWTNIVGVFFAQDAQLQFLFRLSLLVIGIGAFITASRRRKRQLMPFAVLFTIGISLAWGPFAPWAPYTILYEYWPLIEYFRVPYRMLPFALLGSSTLSAASVLHFSEPDDRWTRRGLSTIIFITSIQVLLVHHLLQFEGYPP